MVNYSIFTWFFDLVLIQEGKFASCQKVNCLPYFDLLAANYHIKLFLQAPNTEN